MYRKIILAVAIFIGVKSGELAGAAQAAQLRQAASRLGRRGLSSAPKATPRPPASNNPHGESVQLVPWQNPKNSLQLVPQQNPKSGSNGVPRSVLRAGAVGAVISTGVGISAIRSAIEEDHSRNSDGSVNISHMEDYHAKKLYRSALLGLGLRAYPKIN